LLSQSAVPKVPKGTCSAQRHLSLRSGGQLGTQLVGDFGLPALPSQLDSGGAARNPSTQVPTPSSDGVGTNPYLLLAQILWHVRLWAEMLALLAPHWKHPILH